MSSTRVSRRINAPLAKVFAALIDANAVAKWMVPETRTLCAGTKRIRWVDVVRSDPIGINVVLEIDIAGKGELGVSSTAASASWRVIQRPYIRHAYVP
jgi:hypothetical protein